ncbi:MAG: arylformamidase [Roseibium sp.]|uniref:arylformamidase n=1 Tax=Roseibium sp. TaxID=1936156 RepID=UPI00261B20E8|nr:arylformamidase [Roseibium sp.]MCV0426451.1 arylformamidase [Roseibium sp.]
MTLIIDITPPVRQGMAVFPGDAHFKSANTFEISEDCPVNVAEFSMSCHCGAHADAPLHYDRKGISVDQLDLTDFVGPARVIDARGPEALCSPDMLRASLADRPLRVLLRLADRIDPMVWPEGFRAVSPESMTLLADHGVKLIGVDVPSVDPETSKKLPSHEIARSRDLRILENLALSAVEPGDYELIALPMKLEGLDAAPVRAILRPL